MKTILSLFALVLLCSQAVSFAHTHIGGGWEDQNPQEFMKDSHNQEIFDNAKQQFITQASQANKISSTQLTVQDIKRVSTQVAAGLNIQFSVDLVDTNGKVYDVGFVVWSQPWMHSLELTQYTIN